MKTSILSTLVMLSLSAAFGPVRLMAQDAIHVTIPFGFNVGSKQFVAGEYSIREVAPAALALRSVDGRAQMFIVPMAGPRSTATGIATVTFTRYGNHYFLSRIAGTDKGWELVKSAVEKELNAKRSEPPSLNTIAAK